MAYRQPPKHGALGFELMTELPVTPAGAGVKCAEQCAGKTIGELEISPFPATLIIDRDGVLESKVRDVAAETGRVRSTVFVALPGATGYRAEVILDRGAALPYLYVFAMAPEDGGMEGGVLVTVRSASPEWPAADAMLQSIRIVTRRGIVHANDSVALPIVAKSPRDP
jgi:hypothetical protein